MKKSEFYPIYEGWLRKVNQDALWFMHQLINDESSDPIFPEGMDNYREKATARALSDLLRKVGNARKNAEIVLALQQDKPL